MEADSEIDDLILKQVNGCCQLLNERHLVMAAVFYLNAEVASSKVLPPALMIELVELGPELLLWSPVEVDSC